MILSQKNIEEIAVAVIRDTKIQNCVWDVRRFILLTNLVID